MEWVAFVISIKLLTANFCIQEFPKNRILQLHCKDAISDCVFDGETFEFCKKFEIEVMEEKYETSREI